MTNHKQQSSNDQTPSRIHIHLSSVQIPFEWMQSKRISHQGMRLSQQRFFSLFFSFYAYICTLYTVHTVEYTTVHSKHITHITCCCLPEFAFAIDWMCQVSTCANALACVCVCAKSNKISTHNHCEYMSTQLYIYRYIKVHVSQWIYMNCQYALLLLRTNKQTLRLCAHAVRMCAYVLCMCDWFVCRAIPWVTIFCFIVCLLMCCHSFNRHRRTHSVLLGLNVSKHTANG